MLKFWMVWRYLRDGRKYLSLTFVLSVFGIALGVASLVIAMAVVSGYESTLRDTVINMQGDLMLRKRYGVEGDSTAWEAKIRTVAPETRALTPFVVVEGLVIHNKKISGVVLEGVSPSTVESVLSLSRNLSAGVVDLEPSGEVPRALIGKGIAVKFGIRVGEEFKLVIPVSSEHSSDGFRPKMQKFYVSGILDLGRADYDERYILTDMNTAQNFGEIGDRISGWRLKLAHYELADGVAKKLTERLGPEFLATSWRSINRNLFQAVQYEKVVIFVIVLLMVIAAAFNVSSTLFLSVVRRYSQISILKAMGGSEKFIRQLFTRQGLIVGVLGVLFGLVLGGAGCRLFLWAEKKWGIFPGDVYKLDFVQLELRGMDVALILVVTLSICFLATLAPARRGAKLTPVEGLRYE